MQNLEGLLESQSLWPFTQILQRRGPWTKDHIDTLVEGVKAEAQDLSLQLYLPL